MRKLLLIVLVCCLTSVVFSQKAEVVGENAYLRGTAGETGAVVDTLPSGTEVEIYRQQGNWFLVQASPFVGWMHRDSLRQTSTGRTGLNPDPASKEPKSDPESPVSAATNGKADGSSESSLTTSLPAGASQAPASDKRLYIRGPRGGCYYVRPDGKKVYGGPDQCTQLPLPDSIKKTTASVKDGPR